MQLNSKSLFILFILLNNYTNATPIYKNLQCNNHTFLRESATDGTIVLRTRNMYFTSNLQLKTSNTDAWSTLVSTSEKRLHMFGMKEKGKNYRFLTLSNGTLELIDENKPSVETCKSTFQIVENKLKLYDTETFLFCSKDNFKQPCFTIMMHHR